MPESEGDKPTPEQWRNEQCHKLAHDLKNCLTVIGSGLDVLKVSAASGEGGEIEEVREMMERERQAATRLVGELLEAATAPDAGERD